MRGSLPQPGRAGRAHTGRSTVRDRAECPHVVASKPVERAGRASGAAARSGDRSRRDGHRLVRPHARDLPWRQPGTGAWGVLVSEVMLQQTPVVRVLPAWRAWMARWPDAGRPRRRRRRPRRSGRGAGSATRAGRCACTRARWRWWSGTAARCPTDLDALLALPGVGAYTARAVAAFAYGQRHPVVDTNVRRVVARAVGRARRTPGRPPPPPTWPPPRRCCRPTRRGRPGPASRSWSWARWSAPPARPRCADCPLAQRVRLARSGGAPRRPVRAGGRSGTRAPTGRCAGC